MSGHLVELRLRWSVRSAVFVLVIFASLFSGVTAASASELPVPTAVVLAESGENPGTDLTVDVCAEHGHDSNLGFAGRNFDNWISCHAANSLGGVGKLFNAVLNNQFTTISSSQWNVALGQAARWAGVFSIVAVGLCAVEIVAGLISKNTKRALSGFLFAILAWPLTVISLIIFGRLIAVGNSLSTQILASIPHPGAGQVIELMTSGAIAGAAMAAALAASIGAVSWPLLLLLAFGAGVGLMLLMTVLIAVTYAQILLAAFAPIALMLVGFKGTRTMSSKWLSMAISLVLVKPVIAGVLAINMELLMLDDGIAGLVLGTVGMMLATLSPAAVFKLVGFTGAQLGGALDGAAGIAKKTAEGMGKAGKDHRKEAEANEVAFANNERQIAEKAQADMTGKFESSSAQLAGFGSAHQSQQQSSGSSKSPVSPSSSGTPGAGLRSGVTPGEQDSTLTASGGTPDYSPEDLSENKLRDGSIPAVASAPGSDDNSIGQDPSSLGGSVNGQTDQAGADGYKKRSREERLKAAGYDTGYPLGMQRPNWVGNPSERKAGALYPVAREVLGPKMANKLNAEWNIGAVSRADRRDWGSSQKPENISNEITNPSANQSHGFRKSGGHNLSSNSASSATEQAKE